MCCGKAAGGAPCRTITRSGRRSTITIATGAATWTVKAACPSWSWSLKKQVTAARRADGREEDTSFLIIDAQSVKNTDSAENKGYDAGKKISGIKRHLAVDMRGLPHVPHITTANVSDKAGAKELLQERAFRLPGVKAVLVDGGYSGRPFSDFVSKCLAGATVEVARRSELHTFAVIPKRWVVERSISWLEKCRRLWKNCERKLESSLACSGWPSFLY